jgi:hypothetical protein
VRAVLAVVVALILFVVMWLVIAGIIAAMAWAATAAGVRPGIFLLVNIFLMWVLSPGVGAALAVFAATSHFESIDSKTIFVAFVSICSVVLLVLFCLSLVSVYLERSTFWHLLLFVAQAVSIFGGARIGLAFNPGRHSRVSAGDA